MAEKSFVLPDWVPSGDWKAFVEMRIKIKKPMTSRAKEISIDILRGLKDQGFDPSIVLKNSIACSYPGLYPVKNRASPEPKHLISSRIGAIEIITSNTSDDWLGRDLAEIRRLRRTPGGDVLHAEIPCENAIAALEKMVAILKTGLVSVPCDFMIPLMSHSYREYLLTPQWWERRTAAIKSSHHKCQVCNAGGTGLDVHHRTYDRIGREDPSDLVVLCRGCHQIFHDNGKLAKE